MIEISTDKGILKLSPETTINLRLISPVFNKEIGDNSHSFSFNIPSGPNQRVFGFYDSPLIQSTESSIESDLKIDSMGFKSGVMQVERGSGSTKNYSAKLEIDNSSYSKNIKETLLKDIDLGGVRDIIGIGGANLSLNITQLVAGGLAVLDINDLRAGIFWNPGTPEETILDYFKNQINNNNSLSKATAVRTGTGPGASLDITADSGQSLNFDLNVSTNEQSWTIASQTGTGLTTHQAIIAHMNDVATAANITDYDYCFFPVLNRNFYNGLNSDYLEYINLWDWNTNSFLENTITAGERWRNTAIPFIRTAYLINKICDHLSLTDISTFTQDSQFLTHCLYNNYSLDFVRSESGTDFNGCQSYIDLKNHVPEDATINDVFDYMQVAFNLSIDINAKNKSILFKRKTDITKASSTHKDWRKKCSSKYSISRKKGHEQGFLIQQAIDKSDQIFSVFTAQQQSFQTGAGNTVSTINFPPLPDIIQPHPLGPFGHDWAIPALEQVGRTPFLGVNGEKVEADDFIFRSAMYKGLYLGINTTNTYPYGTCRNIDFYGNSLGDWSLQTTLVTGVSSRGIWEEFYFPFYGDNEEEPEVLTFIEMDLRDLLSLDWHVIHRLICEDGEYDGIIKQIDLKISMSKIEDAQVKFLKR